MWMKVSITEKRVTFRNKDLDIYFFSLTKRKYTGSTHPPCDVVTIYHSLLSELNLESRFSIQSSLITRLDNDDHDVYCRDDGATYSMLHALPLRSLATSHAVEVRTAPSPPCVCVMLNCGLLIYNPAVAAVARPTSRIVRTTRCTFHTRLPWWEGWRGVGRRGREGKERKLAVNAKYVNVNYGMVYLDVDRKIHHKALSVSWQLNDDGVVRWTTRSSNDWIWLTGGESPPAPVKTLSRSSENLKWSSMMMLEVL